MARCRSDAEPCSFELLVSRVGGECEHRWGVVFRGEASWASPPRTFIDHEYVDNDSLEAEAARALSSSTVIHAVDTNTKRQ